MTQPRTCSIARTLEVVGEKWSLLALREVLLGQRRFDQIVAGTGAPRDVLTTRLRRLVGAGLLERVPYSERPPRYEYHPTAAGRDLQPALLMLMGWGDRHLAGEEGPPLVWQHEDHDFAPELSCGRCHRPLGPDGLHLGGQAHPHPDRVAPVTPRRGGQG